MKKNKNYVDLKDQPVPEGQHLLEVDDLKMYFHTEDGVVRAVDGVSYTLDRGETLGVVGESGSGKSVTAMTIMGLISMPPGKIEGGDVRYRGRSILEMTEEEMQHIRGNDIAMIFQDPMTSLNPVLTVEDQILEKQDLDADYDLLTGASFSMKNMIGLKNDVSAQRKDSNHKKQRYYGYTEDYGYGITGWLQVVVEDGKIVRCFYDEIFADHTKDIVYDDLKQFYRQSKYFSTTYEDPFPSGWDRHAWLVCFKDQSDAINKKVCETQDMFDITGLPCVEGPDMGVVWDKPHKDDVALVSNSDATARSVTRPRSPVWNNYLRLAKIVHDEMVKDGAVK